MADGNQAIARAVVRLCADLGRGKRDEGGEDEASYRQGPRPDEQVEPALA
ncbi:hypothetical protein ANO11243_010710 [Dothideomycetidae sp. 11243]|nr:hypothetical protein ANO11243_010710 [fungal sp. No.11243]